MSHRLLASLTLNPALSLNLSHTLTLSLADRQVLHARASTQTVAGRIISTLPARWHFRLSALVMAGSRLFRVAVPYEQLQHAVLERRRVPHAVRHRAPARVRARPGLPAS